MEHSLNVQMEKKDDVHVWGAPQDIWEKAHVGMTFGNEVTVWGLNVKQTKSLLKQLKKALKHMQGED